MIDLLESLVDLVFGTFEKLSGPSVVLILIFGVAPSLLILHLVWWVRRPSAWQRIAKAAGFRYNSSDVKLPRNLSQIDFISSGRRDARCVNVMTREVDGIWECLFDHTTGLRSKGQTRNRTAYAAKVGNLRLPEFRLLQGPCPRGLDKVVKFEYDQDFSRAFTVQSSDPDTTRRLFDQKVRQHFTYLLRECGELERKSNRGLTRVIVRLTTGVGLFEVEGGNDTLVIHLSRYIQPEDAPQFLKLCEQTLAMLSPHFSQLQSRRDLGIIAPGDGDPEGRPNPG